MIIKCILCQAGVAEMPPEEVVGFVRWLDKTGEVPICFRCADRVVTNLYVQHGSEMRQEGIEEASLSFRPDRNTGGDR